MQFWIFWMYQRPVQTIFGRVFKVITKTDVPWDVFTKFHQKIQAVGAYPTEYLISDQENTQIT